MDHLNEDASSTLLHQFDQRVRAAAELDPASLLQNQERSAEALQIAEALTEGGKKDWALPKHAAVGSPLAGEPEAAQLASDEQLHALPSPGDTRV